MYYIYQIVKEYFTYNSDTSKFSTGRALYQIQSGKPKLIAYTSKRLPEAMRIIP